MRPNIVALIAIVGSLSGGHAGAQPDVIPTRLSLASAIRLAWMRNPTLESARRQAAAIDADRAAAKRWPNPTVTAQTAGYNPKPSPVGFIDRQEFTIQAEQEFELGGQRKLREAAAGEASMAAVAGVVDQQRLLGASVQRAYFQLVLAGLDAAQARTSLAEIDRVIAVNRSRYAQGEISGAELRRLEVERLKFSDDVLQAELAMRHSRSALLALLGAPRLDLPIEPTDTLQPPSAPGAGIVAPAADADATGTAAALTARALAERADIASARREQARAVAELAVQKAVRIPNLSIAAGYRRDFGANGLVFGATLPLPLLDRNAPGIARAEAEQRLADSSLRVKELAVALDVQQAVDLVDVSRQRVTAIEGDYLQKARDARDAVLAAYRAGEGDLLDYLDAERAYRDVQRAHNRALYDHRLSLIQLDAAVGAFAKGLLP